MVASFAVVRVCYMGFIELGFIVPAIVTALAANT